MNEIESSQQLNRMENVEHESEQSDSMEADDDGPQSSRGRGDSKGVIVKRGRGRPPKKLKTIQEDIESSDYDFMNQMDNSSRSSWSDN